MSDQSGPQQVQLPQDSETALTTLAAPFGTVLYLYARSGESVSARSSGQDYIAFRYDRKSLAFAVCDGGGQSFMGEVAARVLGDGLVEWLWQASRPGSAEDFAGAVEAALDQMIGQGKQAVEDFKLPDTLPLLVKQALEMQRAYGSEAMFVAGRIALDSDQPWIALCWLGDAPVAAIDIDGKLVDLGPRGQTSERWNALTGVKGPVHGWVGSAERVARVAGYTDGLGVDRVPTDADLKRLMENWIADPPADDASLFDVRLAPSPETVGEPEPDALKKLEGEIAARPILVGESEIKSPVIAEGQPIEIEDEQRTPVAGMQPIESAQPEGAIEKWRPLPGKPVTPGSKERDALARQVQMWQQAAILGLTSAALAMLMVERLLKESGEDEGQARRQG